MNKLMIRLEKIRLRETVLFILAAVTVLYLGADHPVPKGFYLPVLMVIVLAAVQYFCLRWLHRNLAVRKTFLITVLAGAVIALTSALLLILPKGKINQETLIWLVIIMLAGALYGCFIWIVNYLLIRKHLH